MTRYLLDANVLIALSSSTHPDYEKANLWVKKNHELLICPITQGALLRYLMWSKQNLTDARGLILQMRDTHRYLWIPADLNYDDADFARITGHKQVTDLYLAELARHHGALLATFDTGIAGLRPEAVSLIQ
ncbi:MAG: PIN domain-containing protein [Mobiluncus porci]|uniref:Ribonuclease VapC n=1 Tax=Mobiluncus porci TaxID=2652278 RepID=A0A7K0K1I4_9ACTO|nr:MULTISPECIES: PIN domain-containing protein [Mobiluncus]MCI6584284.1 PIN domain-containing protein [Mobiluncus sp.]MDD7540715.1 PIN domain-containing protein [Mobiluncus porci]MDY5748277.1 PIN domain-containing protein [Mobiluncus porci]MST49342.1 PIN domain-containing protein [Mobiluncus porci]